MTALVELRIGDRGPRGAPVVGASPGTRDAPVRLTTSAAAGSGATGTTGTCATS